MVWNFSLEHISLLTYTAVFFIGVLVCFTPCVYPVIPIVVGYIGGSENKSKRDNFFRTLSYVLGLAVVYSLLGAAAALSGEIFGSFQSSFWVNLIVANVFILLGLFMLDVFTLPSIRLFNAGTLSGKKFFGGAFLTGAISALVIGPCTTPVLGGILAYVAAKRNVAAGISLLFTYALGMGFPLLILGTFIGLLKRIPKSGAWMVKIKKVFGLILIASGEYFLLAIK